MTFADVTSEQALSIISHYKAIADIAAMKLHAYVKGIGTSNNGDIVFIQTGYHRVMQLPTRKYFVVNVDGVDTHMKFDDTFDLRVDLADL